MTSLCSEPNYGVYLINPLYQECSVQCLELQEVYRRWDSVINTSSWTLWESWEWFVSFIQLISGSTRTTIHSEIWLWFGLSFSLSYCVTVFRYSSSLLANTSSFGKWIKKWLIKSYRKEIKNMKSTLVLRNRSLKYSTIWMKRSKVNKEILQSIILFVSWYRMLMTKIVIMRSDSVILWKYLKK